MLLSLEEVREKLKSVCREAGSERAWAKGHGLSQPYVNDAINGRREPGAGILKALGLERVVQYRTAKASGSR